MLAYFVRGNSTVRPASCLTNYDYGQVINSFKAAKSKSVKQEVSHTATFPLTK